MTSCSSHLYYTEWLCLGSVFGLRTGMADVVIPRPDDLTLLSNSFVFFWFFYGQLCFQSVTGTPQKVLSMFKVNCVPISAATELY